VLILLALLAALVAVAVAIPASASTSQAKTFTSFECHSKIDRYDARTWACATMVVTPYQVAPGDTTTVAYTFRAKRKLTHLLLCVAQISTDKAEPPCSAYKRKVGVLLKDHTVKATMTLTLPATVTQSGAYQLPAYSHFYKRMGWAGRTQPSYWDTHSYVYAAVPPTP
jgi:hypothetical protein